MPMAKRTHLLLNPKVYPQDWQALCGVFADDTPDSFTTEFNNATCNDCIELELHFVHNLNTPYEGTDIAPSDFGLPNYNELSPEAEPNTL